MCNQFFNSYTKNPTFAGTVTPYIHILSSHVPNSMDQHLNLQRFNQQAVEHWIGVIPKTIININIQIISMICILQEHSLYYGKTAVHRLFLISRAKMLDNVKIPRATKARRQREREE